MVALAHDPVRLGGPLGVWSWRACVSPQTSQSGSSCDFATSGAMTRAWEGGGGRWVPELGTVSSAAVGGVVVQSRAVSEEYTPGDEAVSG